MPDEVRFDEIGYWSEVKLDIIREYAAAYSRILNAQNGLSHIYIDGFAGAGVHRRKETGDFVPGSPLNALNVDPPFKEYQPTCCRGRRTCGWVSQSNERTMRGESTICDA